MTTRNLQQFSRSRDHILVLVREAEGDREDGGGGRGWEDN